MKITFQNTVITEKDNKTETVKTQKTSQEKRRSTVNFGAVYESGQVLPPMAGEDTAKGKSLIELQQEAGSSNVALQQDYMTLLSHTMSQEDYAKACEDGFDPRELDQDTAVTIVDKIKAELARSGQEIIGYTDDLDTDTLAAAVGSESLARSIAEQFATADVPMTRENLEELAKAWDMASSLTEPDTGAKGYLVDNGLEPEIWNLYVAENSGAQIREEEIPEELQEQMDRVIREAELPLTEENRQRAQWLVGAGLPLTAETLTQLDKLSQISFPVTEDAFARAAAGAILDGKSPVYGNLSDSETVYDRAARLEQEWFSEEKWAATAENLTARKQLEEIRLRMTAEVNVKLIQSGFSIDTAPMEQLIEALRRAEVEVAGKYFPQDDGAVAKYETYVQATQVTAELPGLPASVLGPYSLRSQDAENVAAFHAEGVAAQSTYAKAGESYEALMTAPRSDLGDSIRKAFSNVDDILQDLDLDITPENQRAVRILGYNRMELTPENIDRVKEADRQVTAVVDQLTPKRVLEMIREGVNPLEKSFAELEAYFAERPQEYEETTEEYSRFLYQLERKNEITETERKAYIGIYRMVHQIEREDGAAIGSAVNTGAELQFSTLLAAARSRRAGHMDWKVTDDTGLTEQVNFAENHISSQITVGMAREILTDVTEDDSALRDYYREGMQELQQALQTSNDAAELLQRGELPASAANLLAAEAMSEDPAGIFEGMRRQQEKYDKPVNMTEKSADLWKELDEDAFPGEYLELLETALQDTEAMTLQDADNTLDVKQLQLVHKQLTIAAQLQDKEEYFLPMYIGEQLAGVHLTMQQGTGGETAVDISVRLDELQLAAHLEVNGSRVGGYLTGNTPEEVTKLEQTSDIFLEWIREDTSADWEADQLPVVGSGVGTRMAAPGIQKAENIETPVDAKQLYHLAKGFLQSVGRTQEQ